MMLYNGPGIHIEFWNGTNKRPKSISAVGENEKTVHRILIQFCKMLSAKQGECRNGKKAEMEGTHVFHSVCLRLFCNSKAAAFDTPCAFCSLTLGSQCDSFAP